MKQGCDSVILCTLSHTTTPPCLSLFVHNHDNANSVIGSGLVFTDKTFILEKMKCRCVFSETLNKKNKKSSNCSDTCVEADLRWGSNESPPFVSQSWTFPLNHLMNICIDSSEKKRNCFHWTSRTKYWKNWKRESKTNVKRDYFVHIQTSYLWDFPELYSFWGVLLTL